MSSHHVVFHINFSFRQSSVFRRQTVIHNNLPDGVEVKIQKVPDDEFQRPNLCFYVCGDCGTVAYDGRASHQNSKTSQSNDKHLI